MRGILTKQVGLRQTFLQARVKASIKYSGEWKGYLGQREIAEAEVVVL